MRTDFQPCRSDGVGIRRDRTERLDQRGIAEHQRTDRGAAPRGHIQGHHVGLHLTDAEQCIRRGSRVVHHHHPADIVHHRRDGADVDDGSQSR